MPAMVFCLYGYDLGGRGDGGQHCVLWTVRQTLIDGYIRVWGLTMDSPCDIRIEECENGKKGTKDGRDYGLDRW